MSKEQRTAVEGTGWILSWLAETHRRAGDSDRAVELAREGLDFAVERRLVASETFGNLTLARALLASGDGASPSEIEGLLERAMSLAREIELRSLEPLIH